MDYSLYVCAFANILLHPSTLSIMVLQFPLIGVCWTLVSVIKSLPLLIRLWFGFAFCSAPQHPHHHPFAIATLIYVSWLLSSPSTANGCMYWTIFTCLWLCLELSTSDYWRPDHRFDVSLLPSFSTVESLDMLVVWLAPCSDPQHSIIHRYDAYTFIGVLRPPSAPSRNCCNVLDNFHLFVVLLSLKTPTP